MTWPSRDDERGVTLVELIIILTLIALLVALTFLVTRAGQQAARNRSIATAAESFRSAAGWLNTDFPPVAGRDVLLGICGTQPCLSGSWTETNAPRSPAGDPYLRAWPQNPFGGGGVVVERLQSPCGAGMQGAPGRIVLCRPSVGSDDFRIVAWGRKGAASIVVYNELVTN